MDAAQLAQAIAQAGAARPAGSSGGGAQAPAQQRGNNNDDVLTHLLRDHLWLRQDVRPIGDALQLAVLCRSDEEIDEFVSKADHWKSKLGTESKKRGHEDDKEKEVMEVEGKGKDKNKGEKKGGNPLGPKKVFMVAVLFQRLLTIVTGLSVGPALTEDIKKKALVVLKEFTETSPAVIDLLFAGFGPKIPKPSKGRCWLWTITFNQMYITDEIKQKFMLLIAATAHPDCQLKVEVKRTAQSKSEAELWTRLRERR